MRAFIVGDSITANSLGRALSMAISADAVFEEVTVLAYRDGPIWAGAAQFGLDVAGFTRKEISNVADQIRGSAAETPTLLWVSKGADPIGVLVERLRGTPGLTIVADFDDNDVAIMESFRGQSFLNKLKMHPGRRKHPRRLASAQTKVAHLADALTFSNTALADVYRLRQRSSAKDWAIVPHTRQPRLAQSAHQRDNADGLTLGFLGTVRAHKGAAQLVDLMRQDRSVRIVSFRQEWLPPLDCDPQWRTYSSDTPLAELYDKVDFLVLPMDPSDDAATHQLPAKLIDAAVNACPVAATPTPPINEFAGDRILAIESWEDPAQVLGIIRTANRGKLARDILKSFEEHFSPSATGATIKDLVLQHTSGVENDE